MKAGILLIGDELLNGTIQDANASYIAQCLDTEGWQISTVLAVADNNTAIRKGLDFLLDSSDAVIVTGGLGPTADDITTEAIADAFGRSLYLNEEILERIKKRLERYRIRWSDTNAKQALFPEGSEIIDNPEGTACGFALKANQKMVTVVPGVPGEVRRMIPGGVIPLLRREFPTQEEKVIRKTLKILGISESIIGETVSGLLIDIPGVSIGYYPRFPENHLVITSRNSSKEKALSNLEIAEKKIFEKLKENIFGCDDDTIESVVAELLLEKKLTVSVAESCTGGLITDRLTDIPGSSAFLERGTVVYSNLSKTELLEVPASVIEKYGAVSEETAVLMAEGIRKAAKTDLGIATTGIAGPSGGSKEKPVGTVFIALSDGRDTFCRKFLFGWDRRRVKVISAHWALEMLRRYLKGGNVNER